MRIDKRLLRIVQNERGFLLLAALLGFLAGIAVVIQAFAASRAVGQVFLGGGGLEDVQQVLLLLLGAVCARAALLFGAERSASVGALRITARLRQRLFEHILNLGPAYTHGEHSGELVNTCIQGVDSLEAYYSQYLPQIAIAVFVPVTYLALIFPLDCLTGLVLLLTAPLIPIFMVLIGSLGESLTEKQWRTLSRLSAYFYDVLQGLTTLKILGRSRAQAGVLEKVDERYRQITMGVLRVTFLSAFALEMVATLSTAIGAVEIGLRLLYGRFDYEQALFLLLLAPEFYLPLRNLGARFHAGMAGVSAANRIFAILEEHFPSEGADSLSRDERAAGLSVTIREVTYRYPPRADPCISDENPFSRSGREDALRGVSLEIPAGKVVALVGPSGAGKSTLANLLLGFITPTAGDIWINNRPLAGLSLQEWREQIAWVPQKPYIFNDSVLANIRLAKPDAGFEEVYKAARRARADEFIAEPPRGYETLVGERGSRLSSGQAQRISLARAFLKDTPLLILDEATSSLDPELEAGLQESIYSLMDGRTTLVIAHRMSTAYRADRIYVMDGGRIVESGSHASLIAQDGLYRKLVQTYSGGIDCSQILPANLPGGVHASREPSGAGSGCQSEVSTRAADAEGRGLPPGAGTGSRSQAPGLNTLRRLLSLVAPYRYQILFSVLLGVLTVISGIGLMAASAYIISAAALGPSIAALQVPIVGVRAFGISRGLFRYLERYTTHQATFYILARLRLWFYQSLEPLAPARLEGYKGGDLLSRAVSDIASLENFYVRGLAPPMVAIVVTVFSCLLLSTFSMRLGLTLMIFLLAAGVGVPLLLIRGSRSLGAKLVEARGALSSSLADGILGAADLLACGYAGRQRHLVQVLNRECTSLKTHLARFSALQAALLSLLASLAMWMTLLLAIPLVSSGEMEGVYLAVVMLIALTSFEAIFPLPQAAVHLERDIAAAGRLFEIVDAQPQVADPRQPASPPDNTEIQVRSLSFRYPLPEGKYSGAETGAFTRQPHDALQDLTLSLPPGKHVAIVGPSGAGKSTLVKLILRFWEFKEGEIEFAGKDIRSYRTEDIRRQIAVVEQNTHLFNTSIRENLLVANPDANDDDLIQAATLARILEFIQSQPQGLDTLVGEGGLRLSGGERQRVAIARALLRRSPLLILDEPTANLDALVERQIMDTVNKIMQGKTTLLITHRLAGLEAMDEILVLERGKVVERGRHAELLAAGGLYRRLWQIQTQIIT